MSRLSIRNMSFKGKLLLYAASATGTALTLCCAAVMTSEWFEARRELPYEVGVQADVIGLNAGAVLAFDDRAAANELLHGLEADDNVDFASICARDGSEFAAYARSGSVRAKEEPVEIGDYRFSGDRLHLRRPIVLDGEVIGSIYIQRDLQDLYGDLKRLGVILAGTLLISLAGAALVSSRMQRVLTRPVAELAKTAQRVAEDNDYSVRAVKSSTDELGALTDTFNAMLTGIESRDVALQESRYTLEWQVRERTAELSKRQAELRDSELRLRTLLEGSPVCNKIIDLDSRLRYMSRAGVSQLKIPDITSYYGTIYPPDLFPEAARRSLTEHLERAKGGEVSSVECAVHDTEGNELWYHTTFVPACDDEGRIQYVIGSSVNITDRKLMNNELVQAKLAAEAASQAKSEFLANMSHEIRTPMTAILGFAENMLDANQSDDERLDCIHTIRRNGEYLLGIINDILDLSKIEAGKMTIERRACQPCRVVAEVASLMHARADEKGLLFSVGYLGAIPETIQCDPTRLRQILINLIGNAIKFTDVGTVRLVTSFVDDPDAPRLQFDVIDSGRGMTEEQVARLFQPFMQADSSTTRKFGGTGLGLSISKRFAELLGGDVFLLATKSGSGSTFRVTVTTGAVDRATMLKDPASATIVDTVADAATQPARSELTGLRILLAEDGVDNQRLITFLLSKAGADVTVVENGRLALDAALAACDENQPFDCVLMDMQMPVMDGYEASICLRSEGYRGPIIALTAHAMAGDRDKCLNAGCDDYATKPIDRATLIALISRYAAEGKASRCLHDKDPAILVSNLDDDSMVELIELFVADLLNKVAALENAIRRQDKAAIAALAHQLKGSAGGYGFPTITEAAGAVESAVRGSDNAEELLRCARTLTELCKQARARVATG